jgi:hypothetical protein
MVICHGPGSNDAAWAGRSSTAKPGVKANLTYGDRFGSNARGRQALQTSPPNGVPPGALTPARPYLPARW